MQYLLEIPEGVTGRVWVTVNDATRTARLRTEDDVKRDLERARDRAAYHGARPFITDVMGPNEDQWPAVVRHALRHDKERPETKFEFVDYAHNPRAFRTLRGMYTLPDIPHHMFRSMKVWYAAYFGPMEGDSAKVWPRRIKAMLANGWHYAWTSHAHDTRLYLFQALGKDECPPGPDDLTLNEKRHWMAWPESTLSEYQDRYDVNSYCAEQTAPFRIAVVKSNEFEDDLSGVVVTNERRGGILVATVHTKPDPKSISLLHPVNV